MIGPDGEVVAEETRLTLRRCGNSRNQPFCDNSHRGRFTSRLAEVDGERRTAETPAAFEPNRDVPAPPA